MNQILTRRIQVYSNVRYLQFVKLSLSECLEKDLRQAQTEIFGSY